MAEAGEAPVELGDHAAHRIRLDLDLGLPAGEAAGSRAGNDNLWHYWPLTLSLSPQTGRGNAAARPMRLLRGEAGRLLSGRRPPPPRAGQGQVAPAGSGTVGDR